VSAGNNLPWFSYSDKIFVMPEGGTLVSCIVPDFLRSRKADSIHNCFSNSNSRYTDASTTSTHSSLRRSRMIFGLAASILRIFLCKSCSSTGGTRCREGSRFFCRNGGSSNFDTAGLGNVSSSSRHSHISGGFQESFRPLEAMEKVVDWLSFDVTEDVLLEKLLVGTGKSKLEGLDLRY
jgi:hypothetical protein